MLDNTQRVAEQNIELVVFVALMPEARPLIEHWRLRLLSSSLPFAMYQNGAKVLVVTGMGKANMAAAVAFSLGVLPNQNAVLINLGIAGHPSYTLGSLWLAHKISDAESGKSWYPPMSFLGQTPSTALMSFSRPHADYQYDALYDMEASAFYEIACRFSSPELIHSIKLVSDNREQGVATINPQQVVEWITAKVPEIEKLLMALHRARHSVPEFDAELYQTLLDQWHFSATNAIRLRYLLQKWRLLMDEDFNWKETGAGNAKQLLNSLEQHLESIAFSL